MVLKFIEELTKTILEIPGRPEKLKSYIIEPPGGR